MALRIRWAGVLGFVAASLASVGARAATYYVAPNGDDASGDGSAASPWATIAHAVNSGIGAEGGHEIVVRDGLYMGTNLLQRGFPAPVTIRAEHAYHATLSNTAGGMEAIRIYLEASANIVIRGFVISNFDSSYTCPNGRESYYLIHLQDVSDVTLEDNVIFGNNAPGTCNELLKVNRGSDTAYPRGIVVRGNVFSERANAGGADMIDAVRQGEIDIVENVFFGHPGQDGSQAFITLKTQAPATAPASPRYRVSRNVFFNWSGLEDQAFIELGEDGMPELEITDALIENNLFLGNSPDPIVAPMQFKGAAQLVVRANTVVGNLPGGSFGFRIGTEGSNPQVGDIAVRNNVFCDPTGTMTDRLFNIYGDVDLATVTLARNLYWNSDGGLPTTGSITPADDASALVADPALPADQSALVLPTWDGNAGTFASGSTTIRQEFLRLVEAYGALGAASAAIGAADGANMPIDDIRGLARDSSPDLGAYEHGASEPAGGAGGSGMGGNGTGAHGNSGPGASGPGGSGAAFPGDANGASEEGSGCGCRLALRGGEARLGWLGLGLLALGARRRRP